MNRIIKSSGDWNTKSASVTDMFYMLPALATAYTTPGAEYIDLKKAIEMTYDDLENNRVKIKDDVTDALISGVLCRKVNSLVKAFEDELSALAPVDLEDKKAELKDLLTLLSQIKIYSGIYGIVAELGEYNADTTFGLTIECYLRGEPTGVVSFEKATAFKSLICPSHNIAKHQVISLRIKIDAKKSNQSNYTCILANRSDGVAGAIIFGPQFGVLRTNLEPLNADLGDLNVVRSST